MPVLSHPRFFRRTMTHTVSEGPALPLVPEIPPELYRPIVEHINDISTLYALSLTCRILRYEAERLLYACISQKPAVSPVSPTTTKYNYTQVLFLNTILSHNPRLASLVREYDSNSIVDYRRNPLWDLTKCALRCMINLKVLNFRAFGGHPAAEELLVGCPFRLEKLHWGCHSDEEAMKTVLAEQQDLKELYLEGRRTHVSHIPRTACPNLVAHAGNRAVIEALLPGRKVRSLSWIPDLEDSITEPVVGMDDELGALCTLSFGGYFARPNFASVAHQLSSLEVLELIGSCSMEEFELLKTLPSLRELVVSLRWGSSQFPIPSQGRFLVVQTFFRDCPKLSLVDVVHEWIGVGLIRYQRWTRFSVEPVLVTMDEVRMGQFVH